MKKILAYRFSAFGDVAMAASVFREFLIQNPDVEITMVTREHFRDLFTDIPQLNFIGIDLDDYKGILGIRKLAKKLIKKVQPDYVADLHDVIRTKIISKILQRNGYKVYTLNKGKHEKEWITDVWNIDKKPLKRTVERYADVLRAMGYQVILSHQLFPKNPENKSGIGFAPFAQHTGKILPLQKSFELARILAKKEKIYFFGGGATEVSTLEDWASKIPNTESLAGKMSLNDELQKIAELKLMISMDSANMHLASFVGTRCVSIWGATHPFTGFLGYGQKMEDVVQLSDLTCRPCSVFGDKVCYRGDYACLNEISIQQIIDKVLAT